jgi:hypothetical protein
MRNDGMNIDVNDREATFEETHHWLEEQFGPNGASQRAQLADVHPTFGDLEYFEKHGIWFPKPGLHGYTRMPGDCFENCAKLMRERPASELLYVQGLYDMDWSLLYSHSWLTDAQGHWIELTYDLDNYDGRPVFGVPFTLQQLNLLEAELGPNKWYQGFATILAAGKDSKDSSRR